MAQAMVLEAVQIRQLLPVRPRFSHKGDFGRVLLVCGSVGLYRRCGAGGPGCTADRRGAHHRRNAAAGLAHRARRSWTSRWSCRWRRIKPGG